MSDISAPKQTAGSGNNGLYSSEDMDAPDILPLAILSDLQTEGLRNVKMVIDSRMNRLIQLYDDPHLGRSRCTIDEAPTRFGIGERNIQDFDILRTVATLPSFDIYTLRKNQTERAIHIDAAVLKLSDEMNEELQRFMLPLMQPLLISFLGNDLDFEAGKLTSIDAAIKNHPEKVRKNVPSFAKKLGMEDTQSVEKFLGEYQEICTQLSYYERTLAESMEAFREIANTVSELAGEKENPLDEETERACGLIRNKLIKTHQSVRGAIAFLKEQMEQMAGKLSMPKFKVIKRFLNKMELALSNFVCLLSVKAKAWREFTKSSRWKSRRAEFIRETISPGVEQVMDARFT